MAKKIAKIDRQKRRKNRYTIIFDDGSFLGIDQEVLYRLNLSEGQCVNSEEMNYIILEEEKKKALDYCAYFLSFRPRTKKEVETALKRKGYSFDLIQVVCKYMEEQGYLHDEYFVDSYLNDRAKLKPMGRKRLAQELHNKGISKELIERKLQKFTFSEELRVAQELLQKQIEKKGSFEENREKIISFLLRRGFSYVIINKAIEEYEQLRREND